MAVDEPRRVALHRAAAASWGVEVADTLVELVAPSGHELATRQDIEGILEVLSAMDARWDERFAASDARWDERFAVSEARWHERFAASEARHDERLAASEARWDERFATSEVRQDERAATSERGWDERFAAQDRRWQAEAAGLRHELLAAFERRFADAVNHQTRTLVISQLVALVVIAGLAFGLR